MIIELRAREGDRSGRAGGGPYLGPEGSVRIWEFIPKRKEVFQKGYKRGWGGYDLIYVLEG